MAPNLDQQIDEHSNLLHDVPVDQFSDEKGQPVIVKCYHDLEQCDGNCTSHHHRRRDARRGCCSRLFWTLAVIAAVGFMAAHLRMFRLHGHRDSWNDLFDIPNDEAAIAAPFELPEFCKVASIPYKPGALDYSFDYADDSSSNSFHFDQHYERNKNPLKRHYVPVFGGIKVQHVEGGDHDVAVDLDIKLTHAELADLIHIEESKSGLTLKTELSPKKILKQRPCIVVKATVSVSPSANLSSFAVDVTALHALFAESLDLHADNLVVNSVVGSVKSETDLKSRKVEVITTSGSITGSYPLADLLSLKSTVGHIDVEIQPKDAASDKKEVAATLVVNSKSGSVKTCLKGPVPDREYKTSITTVSSSISGEFPLGTTTTIEATSGQISAKVIPYGATMNRTLVSGTRSGTIRLLVDDNQGEKGYALATLKTKLSSISGSVHAHFPAGWEGDIKAHTLTGSVLVGGPRVEIISDKPVPGGGRSVEAVRGGGDSSTDAGTVTGTVTIKLA